MVEFVINQHKIGMKLVTNLGQNHDEIGSRVRQE